MISEAGYGAKGQIEVSGWQHFFSGVPHPTSSAPVPEHFLGLGDGGGITFG
jgi:hypothetical protein